MDADFRVIQAGIDTGSSKVTFDHDEKSRSAVNKNVFSIVNVVFIIFILNK